MVCQNIGPAVAESAGPVPPPLAIQHSHSTLTWQSSLCNCSEYERVLETIWVEYSLDVHIATCWICAEILIDSTAEELIIL